MKLCGLTQSYAPTGGGVRTMLHAQRDWFQARGMQHVMIVPAADDSVMRDGTVTTYTVASPLLPGSAAYRLLYRSDKVMRILRAEMPDVIEVHCAYNLPWTAFWHRRRHGGIVSGVYMTDLPIAYVETPLRKRAGRNLAAGARRLTERYLQALYSRCDVAIAISPAMRDRLRDIGVTDPHCVPLGVDLETFSPACRSTDLRESMGAGEADFVIVYAGRLDAEKQPDVVFDAFEQLPPELNARLVMAGDGPLRETLAHRAARNPRVRLSPFIQDRRELASLLASCDLYASAMAHETFGLSVIEAQACGLPVVGVRAGAMVDRVRDGADGFLVDPDSPAAMAQRIARTPRADWRTMGARAHARVTAEFSWSRTFETLLKIYSSR